MYKLQKMVYCFSYVQRSFCPYICSIFDCKEKSSGQRVSFLMIDYLGACGKRSVCTCKNKKERENFKETVNQKVSCTVFMKLLIVSIN